MVRIPETLTSPEVYRFKKELHVPVRFKITDIHKGTKQVNVGWTETGHLRAEYQNYYSFSYQVIHAETNEVIAEEEGVESIEDRGFGCVEDWFEYYDFGYADDVYIAQRVKQLLDEVHNVYVFNLYDYQCDRSAPSEDYPAYKFVGFHREFFKVLTP